MPHTQQETLLEDLCVVYVVVQAQPDGSVCVLREKVVDDVHADAYEISSYGLFLSSCNQTRDWRSQQGESELVTAAEVWQGCLWEHYR